MRLFHYELENIPKSFFPNEVNEQISKQARKNGQSHAYQGGTRKTARQLSSKYGEFARDYIEGFKRSFKRKLQASRKETFLSREKKRACNRRIAALLPAEQFEADSPPLYFSPPSPAQLVDSTAPASVNMEFMPLIPHQNDIEIQKISSEPNHLINCNDTEHNVPGREFLLISNPNTLLNELLNEPDFDFESNCYLASPPFLLHFNSTNETFYPDLSTEAQIPVYLDSEEMEREYYLPVQP